MRASEPVRPEAADDQQFPLSPLQESLFFLYLLDPRSPSYNNALALRLRGKLRLDVFQRCIDELVRRHGALRATFSLADGQPFQVVSPSVRHRVRLVDLGAIWAEERPAEALRLATEEARRAFDLGSGPPVRFSLFRLADDDYVFTLIAHHIISDASSQSIAMRELSTLYSALARGEPPSLEPLPLEYAEYCRQQRGLAAADRLARDLAHWKRELDGASPILELPTDRPRPTTHGHAGGRLTFRLPPERTRGLRDLARRQGVTLFTTLLAAFQCLLHRYTRHDDFLIGTPVTRRVHPALRGMVGYFVNPVVIRARFEQDLPFAGLLERTRRAVRAALAHAEVPFDRVVQELRPVRAPGRNPLFQVLFSFLDARVAALSRSVPAMHDLDVTLLDPEMGAAQFDLALCVRDRGDQLELDLEYDRDLFEPDTIARMASHLQVLIDAVIGDPGRSVSRLPLMTSAERHLVTEQWNDTAFQLPADELLHERFEQQADRTPEAVALVDGDRRATYLELDRLATRASHQLRDLGVRPDELVGLWAPRLSIELVVDLLAILKAGAAYVAIDPAWPRSRIVRQLEDLQVRYVVGAGRHGEPLPGRGSGTIAVDLGHGMGAGASPNLATRLGRVARADSLAYAISTSGSTGRPKAVGITHANAVAFLHWARRRFSDDELAGVLATTTPIFDCTLFELFAPLSWGGTAILADSVLSLASVAERSRVTLVSTVPSVMAELLRGSGIPPSVRTVNLAGEALDESVPRRVFAASGVERVYNFYGPSETTTYATGHLITRDQAARSTGGAAAPMGTAAPRTGSVIGRPIGNVRVYILDGNDPTPIGVPGELCVGGAGVGRGYLNRPTLTAEAFVPDPFVKRPGARMYRTGDIARYRRDGAIEFLGRRDRQVKIRGVRIELGEIEATLCRHPGVHAAVVDAPLPDQPTGDDGGAIGTGETTGIGGLPPAPRGLVAYIVPRSSEADPEDIRQFAARHLPRYMVPAHVVAVDALPLTPNGKLDRRAVPAPATQTGSGLRGPCDYLELALFEVWQAALGRTDIGRADDFFDLGGHSLLTLVVLSMIREQLDLEVTIETFVANPTIEQLARALRERWVPVPRGALVRVSHQRSGSPLFFVHGGSGDVAFLQALVNEVELGRPLFGFRSIGRDGYQEPLATVPAMADRYLEEMRQVAPSGPYLLAGNCMGGLVAYEMAQRLRAAGEDVAFLGLVETGIPGPEACHPYDLGFAALDDGADVDRLIGHRLAALRNEFAAIGAQDVIDRDVSAASVGGAPSFFRRWIEVSVKNDLAARQYVPRPYHGRLSLFVDSGALDLKTPWAPLAHGGLEVHVVHEGDGPLAMRVATGRLLKRCLDLAAPTAAPVGAATR